jgi:hypothetical protein
MVEVDNLDSILWSYFKLSYVMKVVGNLDADLGAYLFFIIVAKVNMCF